MSYFTIAEFWSQQSFAYIETYSFNRGPKSAELYEGLRAEIAQTKQAQQQARYMDQAKLAYKLRQLEEAMRGGEYKVTLRDPSLAVADYTTRKIAVLHLGAAATEQLGELLQKSGRQEAFAMCAPIFRDALVFYTHQGQRARILNICFECLLMVTDENKTVEADFATYDSLGSLLTQLGHPIGV